MYFTFDNGIIKEGAVNLLFSNTPFKNNGAVYNSMQVIDSTVGALYITCQGVVYNIVVLNLLRFTVGNHNNHWESCRVSPN